MALYKCLCGLTVMIILASTGCHAQKPKCGLAPNNKRIVGGQDASPGSWPWLVSLNMNGDAFCAGSLITDQWVLSAAHCFSLSSYSNVRVYLGLHDQSNLTGESRGIKEVIIHPLYDSLSDDNDNDICLVKMSAPVNFTDDIYPVCLASANSTFHSGTSSWVAGWGSTGTNDANILQEVNLPIVGNKECSCSYPEITKNMMCAGLKAGGKDSCQGDSGGALVTKKASIWIQNGIVSFGEGCAKPMFPGVYTRVSQYQEWISNITTGSTPGFVTYISPGVDSDLNFTCGTVPPKTTPAISWTSAFTRFPPPSTAATINTTDKDGNSIFDSSESMTHTTHFTLLCSLLLSLYALFVDA